MGYLDTPKIGDRVITRRGLIGTLIKFYSDDGVVIRDDEGNEHTACIQACKKVEE